MAAIDKAEVLRYLGHRGQQIDSGLDTLIDGAIERCRELARPRWVFRAFGVERREGFIALAEAGLDLAGGMALSRLEGAERAVVLAVTVGAEVDGEIRALQHRDMTRSLALDAAATACVESVCDEAEAAIAAETAGLGLHMGARFSPGYGDLPLELQPRILAALDAGRRIGLTCTDSLILLPRKSVTAFIGLFPCPSGEKRGCDGCERAGDCRFRPKNPTIEDDHP